MSLRDMVLRAGKLVTDNSPAILAGVAGTVTTAILSAKATYEALQLLDREDQDLETKEKIEKTWQLYIPAAAAALTTIAAIIFATKIGTRRAAAMAAAYAISEKGFEEYRDKILEKMGDKKEEIARAEMAQERVTANPPPGDLLPYGRSVLCMDAFTGRYFLSDMETIKAAENKINHRILVGGELSMSLSEFYEEIGLERTSMSDDVGWNVNKLLELKFSSTITPIGHPCLVMDFHAMPIRFFEHY
jgi:hypothetical protein